jgi:hypothetical protein
LETVGIKQSLSGFSILIDLIYLGIILDQYSMSDLYIIVAEEYSTSPLAIERSVRYCLKPLNVTIKEYVVKVINSFKFAENK